MTDSSVALVTGCSSGIGHATALALKAAGIETWATARRLEALHDLEAAGCRTARLDVTDEASRAGAVASIEAEHGAVDLLVTNAGYAEAGPLEELPLDALHRQFDTNVYGLLRLCQLVLPAMRAHGGGTIINVGSVGGLLTAPGGGAYHMTKHALESLSDALRYEVAGFGVRVVLLEPDGVLTKFGSSATSTLRRGGEPSPYDGLMQSYEQLIERTYREGARGMLRPEAVAAVVVRAATARRPRTRYRIGARARVAPHLRRLVGDRGWDRIMARQFPM